MRVVSVFPLDEFRLALKKVYGAAAPKGPFTALSQATLFFSRNSCTIACCNLNQWCQATIPAQGDEFSLTLYDTQRLLDACAYFSGELHLEYETAEKKPHNCDIPYNQARFSCGGREIHQLVFDSDLYPLPKEFQPEQVYQINAGTVFGLFTQVRHAVSSDTNRPWSCCVQFADHRMYALDGYRLSVRTIPDFEAAKPFQIPEEAMELLSVFADEDCTLSIGREWLSVQNDSKRLITRVPPLGGLKLDSTIPTIFTEARWIDVEGTRNDLKYLLKMENKKLRAPLRLGDGWLSVRGNSGLYRAELRMERPPAIVIGYDPRYLLDAFDAFAKRGIKTARMSFTSPVGPTVLTADNGFTELILPVRLKPEEATTYIPPRKQVAYKQSSPNAKEESGMKGAGTTAPVNPTEAGKAGEAIQQDQELMKAFLARAGKGEDRLADDFDFLKLKAMYVLLKDVGYTIRLKPMTDPPSPAYQRGDGQEAGSKIEPVPVTESAERSNAA